MENIFYIAKHHIPIMLVPTHLPSYQEFISCYDLRVFSYQGTRQNLWKDKKRERFKKSSTPVC